MQRRRRVEDRDEQIVAEFGVHLDAAVDDVLQTDAALDDDERAGLRGSQSRRGEHDLVVDAFAELAAVARENGQAKRLPNVMSACRISFWKRTMMATPR